MKTLFNPAHRQEFAERMQRLTPDAERRWGTMTASKAIPGKKLSRTVSQRTGVFMSRRIGEPGIFSPTLRLPDSPPHCLDDYFLGMA